MNRPWVETRLGPNWIRVRLQHPPYNALTPEVCRQLAGVLSAAAANPEIRAILLDAQGPTFCVGADLSWAEREGPAGLCQLVRSMHLVCEVLLTAPKPVVAAVGGTAAGGGLALALCADVRIASLRASFRLAYPSVGLSLDGGCSFRLPQLIGMARTQNLLFDDRTLSASAARDLGLVDEAVHPERFEERAWQRLEALANGPTLALGESKRLLNPPEWVRQQLEREAEAMERGAHTLDGQAGVQSFVHKRRPVFEGR